MMKWLEIRKQYPGKFILLGDIVEEKITDTKFRILGGRIIEVSDDPKKIRKAYQDYKKKEQMLFILSPAHRRILLLKMFSLQVS